MVSVGVSGPTGPFIGCEKKQRLIGCDLEGCQTPRLQLRSSPIGPRCWLLLDDSKGKLAAGAPNPARRAPIRERGSSDSPSSSALAPRPHQMFTRMQLPIDPSESRAVPLPSIEPRPKEHPRLPVQSTHSTGGSRQGSGSDSELQYLAFLGGKKSVRGVPPISAPHPHPRRPALERTGRAPWRSRVPGPARCLLPPAGAPRPADLRGRFFFPESILLRRQHFLAGESC